GSTRRSVGSGSERAEYYRERGRKRQAVSFSRSAGRFAGAHDGRRQGEEEARALAERGLDPDIAAEAPGNAARQRQPQPRPAELPRGRAVALAELIEDQLVHVRVDADPGVAHFP